MSERAAQSRVADCGVVVGDIVGLVSRARGSRAENTLSIRRGELGVDVNSEADVAQVPADALSTAAGAVVAPPIFGDDSVGVQASIGADQAYRTTEDHLVFVP